MSTKHSPDGFVHLGLVGEDALTMKPAAHDEQVGTLYIELKTDYSVSLDVFVDFIHTDFWALAFGPQFALAQQFSRYTPFWYLKGNE